MESATTTLRAPTNAALTRFIDVCGVRTAYRWFGPSIGRPLVLFQRFRGVMAHWDPALVAELAVARPVILFDSAGVGLSGGVTPDSIEGMALFGAQFLSAMKLGEVDALGWSMGGAVVQRLALDAPSLLRRVVLAGTGPGGGVAAPGVPSRVWEVARKPVNDEDDFLYLFFTPSSTSVAAGRAHLARLAGRPEGLVSIVAPTAVAVQARAIQTWSEGKGSAYARLSEIRHPALIANGVHDIMTPAMLSFVMAERMPLAKLILYPDAGHGFLFQHHIQFASDVRAFLDEEATY